MKLLFLCKRRPMDRDLLTRPYGRFFYLPRFLAQRGHEVCILLLDYQGGSPVDRQSDGMRWISVPWCWYRPFAYIVKLKQLVAQYRPDWLIGCSDIWYGILASRYAHRNTVRVCIDAYDNFESYIPWLKPLHLCWRRALKRADLLTAAGPGLLERMTSGRHDGESAVVPMATDPVGFEPMDRKACRKKMGLPLAATLIGYCGSMHRTRGVEVLFRAFEMLRRDHPDVILVHSGRTCNDVPLPAFVHALGYIDDELMPVLLNCMDVLVVTIRPSAFGDYSYPVKLYEAMACGVPVVVTRTGPTSWILGENSPQLVPPDDPEAMCQAIARNLQAGSLHYDTVNDWNVSGDMLETAFIAAGNKSA